MSLQLMVDLETLSTEPNAAILSIGACTFALDAPLEVASTFETVISIESNEAAGLHISGGTVAWWLKQSVDAQQALFDNPTNLRSALTEFNLWCQKQTPRITEVWANDPDFDVVILSRAFKSLNMLWPFQFWQNRSTRTVSQWAFPDPDDLKEAKHFCRGEGTAHKAVDDAVAQAKLVQLAYRALVTNNSFVT